MQYPITRQDKDEVAIGIWLEQEKMFHLFISTICASIKFSELPVSIGAWRFSPFTLAGTIVLERHLGEIVDTVVRYMVAAKRVFRGTGAIDKHLKNVPACHIYHICFELCRMNERVYEGRRSSI